MVPGDNIPAKWSETKMEGEVGVRTMECLRGRLLAERVASRVAKEETEQMGKKMIELENQLKTELKSRNRAEKKFKLLLQKLESLNMSYVSDESSSENSSFTERSEISSVSSSTASSSNKQTQIYQKVQTTSFRSSGESHYCPSHEKTLGVSDKSISGNSHGSHCSQDEESLQRDENGYSTRNQFDVY